MGVCVLVDDKGEETWIDSPSGDTIIVWERESGGTYKINGYIKGLVPGIHYPAWSFGGMSYENEINYMQFLYDHASAYYCYAGWTMRYLDDKSRNKYVQGYVTYLEYLNATYGIESFPIDEILPVPQQTTPYPPETPPISPETPEESPVVPPSDIPVIEPPVHEAPVENPPHVEPPPYVEPPPQNQESEEETHTDDVEKAIPYIAIAAAGFLAVVAFKIIGRR